MSETKCWCSCRDCDSTTVYLCPLHASAARMRELLEHLTTNDHVSGADQSDIYGCPRIAETRALLAETSQP